MNYTDYYVIQGWMIMGLNLKGINLSLYAIIYGFSKDGHSSFRGSLSYLQTVTSASRPTLIKSLTTLVDLGYIIKTSKIVHNIKLNSYSVSLQVVKKFNRGGSKETLQGSKETLHNKEVIKESKIKKENIKEKKISMKRTSIPKSKIPEFYFEYSFFTSSFSEIWFKEFIPMKKMKKASTTERALKSQLKKIANYSNSNYDKALEILERSVNGGWTDFYALKDSGQASSVTIGSGRDPERKYKSRQFKNE